MEDKKFGSAGNTMVIEEFMTGREVSVLSFVDGKTIKTMTSAQDHKRANKTEKQEVITIADIFRAKVVDVSKDNLMIELTGNVNKIEAFINLISDFEVIEIVRTGITGLSRGEDNSNIF